MGKFKELAPTLVAAGIDRKEIKNACIPRKPAPPKPAPTIAPKRIKAAYQYILEGKDNETICRLACVPLDVVSSIRAEYEAVKASLASTTPVEYDAIVELAENEIPPKNEPKP